MRSFKKSLILSSISLMIMLILGTSTHEALEKTPLSISDSLRIKSFSPQAITDNGRFIAGTLSMRKDRFGTDHKRYRDPTYNASRKTEVVILDTDTQEMHPIFKSKVQVRQLTWSPDGKTLAFFLLEGDSFFLHTYNRDKKKVKKIKLKTLKPIASNSFLVWTNDGLKVILALREEGWIEKSRALFKEATAGPVTIYDSRKPFLKWDLIRDQSSLLIPAIIELKDHTIKELLPKGRYSSIRLAEDNTFITFIQTYPLKTEYGKNYYRNGGREYELFQLGLKGIAEPKTLIKRREKRLNLSWNKDNTMFAWEDEGDIFLQTVEEAKARNLTKDKVKPEEEEKKDKKSGEEKDKEKQEKKVRFSMIRFSPDGLELLASTKKGLWLIYHKSEKLEMVYKFPEEKKEDSPRGGPRPASVVSWSPDSHYLYMTYSATDKWERGFTRYNLKSRSMEDLIKDSNLYNSLQMSEDGEKFFYSFSNGDLPSDLYKTGKDFKETIRLTDLNPWVKTKKLTRSELVKYLDVDGNELFGILYYPVDYEPGKKYPLVCEIYERFFDNGFNSSMNIIANQGWFGLRPSVNLEIGYPGEAWVKGVTSIINKLIEKGMVDPHKLGVHGTSYGGYAASLLITQTDRFAAAVNISGKVNIISFLGDSPRIGHRNYGAAESGQDRIGATLWEQPLKYINHSAVMFADRIKTPHLLITGEGDWNVPAGNTRELYYAMRRLGKECVWVNYHNDGHGLGSAADEATYLDKWKRILNWYKTHFAKAAKEKESSLHIPGPRQFL